MVTRLHSKYPKLADKILAAPPDAVRRIVRAAGRLAIQNSGLDESMAGSALAAIDGRERLRVEVREHLRKLHEHWDNSYLDMQDTLEAHQSLPREAVESFRRARALAAVLGATDPVADAEATEIVYEAIASSTNEKEAAETIADAAQT